MKALIFVFFCISVLPIMAQKATPSYCVEKNFNTFKEMISINSEGLIGNINDREWFDFPWYTSGLQENILFSEIYQNPLKYLPCYKKLIFDKNIDGKSKHIALLSMQKLEFKNYISVISSTVDAFNSNKINSNTLLTSFTQDYEWSYEVINNISSPELKKNINSILSNQKVPKLVKNSLKKFMKSDPKKYNVP